MCCADRCASGARSTLQAFPHKPEPFVERDRSRVRRIHLKLYPFDAVFPSRLNGGDRQTCPDAASPVFR